MASTEGTNGLQSLFLDALMDMYYAENKILEALPKMSEASQHEELSAAFIKHRIETEGQVKRLEQVFEILGEDIESKECPAINGILAEGEDILEEYADDPALDAGLIGAVQAVEHYEIARYGTLVAWAEVLGLGEAGDLLQANLDEELATDEALSALGEGGINQAGAENEEA